MKRNPPVGIFLLAIVLMTAGCRKDEAAVVSPTFAATENEQDAAELVGAAIGGPLGTNGLTAQIEEAAWLAQLGNLHKTTGVAGPDGVRIDTTITRQRTGLYSYAYTIIYAFAFSNLGNRLDFGYTMTGSGSTPRMSASDTVAAGFAVTHLTDPDTNYALNVSYSRRGHQSFKTGSKNSYASQVAVGLANIGISKASRRITSGSGAVTVQAQRVGGGSFSFAGTVTFQANQQVLLLINGKSFVLDLTRGEVTVL